MATTKKPPEGITFADLVSRDIPEPRWVVPGLLPEGLTLISGKPKLGKSWLALALCIAQASGGLALGKYKCEAGGVAYLALEDNERRMKGRIMQMLGDSPAPASAHFFSHWPRLNDGGLDALQSWLKEHPLTRLVVVDTLQKIRPRPKANGHLYSEDYDALAGLKSTADSLRLAIAVIHHTRKSDAEDIFDTPSGSTGITGAPDTLWILKRDRGQQDAVLHVTGRDIDEQELALQFDAQMGLWTVIGDADEFKKSEERTDVRTLLRSQPGLSAKDISLALGKSYDATRRLLWKMSRDGDVKQYGSKYVI